MKQIMKLCVVLAAAVVACTGCNCFSNMAKNPDAVKVTATPEVLTLNNGVVAAEIRVTFPTSYFNKKAILRVTPVLVFEGGEVAGTTKYFQGSSVKDNYTVVSATGGSFTQRVEFPYDERMDRCELQLRAEIKCPKGACKEFTLVNLNDGSLPTKAQKAVLAGVSKSAREALKREFGLTVAYGLNTLQKQIKYGEMMEPMAHNYKKVRTVVTKTDVRYGINSSNVTDANRRNANLDIFRMTVDNNLQNDRATQSIAVKGYASPDGPEAFNDKLSKARSESSKKLVAALLADTGLEVDAAAYGEDWDGFKELIEQSNMPDKNLILQVLSLYNSPVEREKEIKNLASVFESLKSDVLPELRRAQVINSTDIQGNTDDEIMAAVREGRELTADEYLYAAEELVKDPEQQVKILTIAVSKYNDPRVYNNLGVALTKMGANDLAMTSFEKAAKLDSSSELNKNLMLANLAAGKTAEAQKYAGSVDAAGKAALAAAEGNYTAASGHFNGYNAAIVSLMNNDLTSAKRAIDTDMSADADYLRAVIAAKQGDLATAKNQLNSATAKDPSLAQKAAKDVLLKEIAK